MTQNPSSQTQDPQGHPRYLIVALGSCYSTPTPQPVSHSAPGYILDRKELSPPSFRVRLGGALLTAGEPSPPWLTYASLPGFEINDDAGTTYWL